MGSPAGNAEGSVPSGTIITDRTVTFWLFISATAGREGGWLREQALQGGWLGSNWAPQFATCGALGKSLLTSDLLICKMGASAVVLGGFRGIIAVRSTLLSTWHRQ